jgi:hypothetical protein
LGNTIYKAKTVKWGAEVFGKFMANFTKKCQAAAEYLNQFRLSLPMRDTLAALHLCQLCAFGNVIFFFLSIFIGT